MQLFGKTPILNHLSCPGCGRTAPNNGMRVYCQSCRKEMSFAAKKKEDRTMKIWQITPSILFKGGGWSNDEDRFEKLLFNGEGLQYNDEDNPITYNG